MKRRLRRAKIKFLSLVPRGANRLPTILKDDGAFEVCLLTKDMTDNGELHAIVYAPEFRDSQNDIASAAVIKDMAYDAAKHGVEIDVRHDGKAVGKDRAYVAESFIVQKDDPRFEGLKDYDGNAVNPEGSWGVVIKIDDPELKKSYQDGSWRGVSMAGVAEVEHEKQDDANCFVKALAKKLGLTESNHEENDMALTQEDIQKITEGVVATMTKQADEKAKADAEAIKKTADEKAKADDNASKVPVKAPFFKGDPTNADDVKTHQVALRKHKLMADVDWSDPESVAKLQETLKAEAGDDPKASEIAKLQGQIDTLQGRSNQSHGGGGQPAGDEFFVGIDKEFQEAAAVGSAMAKYSNTLRGF